MFEKKNDKLLFAAIIISALILRFLLRDYASKDFSGYISVWINHFRNNGGIHGLKNLKSDYNVVYNYLLIIISYFRFNDLYLVKLISVIFDFALAFGAAALSREAGVGKKRQLLCFFLILFLPTVVMNSSLWAQCDSMYAAFIVWSLYFLIKDKPIKSVAFVTLAFALKLQTVFIAPVFLIALIYKKIKIRHIFVFPITYILTIIPALIFGSSLKNTIMVYFVQSKEYLTMSLNSASIFSLFRIERFDPFLEKVSIITALLIVIIIVAEIYRKKQEFTPEFLISVSFYFSLLIPFLLPHMHDRYFYVSEIFSVTYFVCYGKKRLILPLLLQASALLVYFCYFGFIGKIIRPSNDYLTPQIAGLLQFFAVIILSGHFYYDYFTKELYNFKKLITALVIASFISAAGIYYFREKEFSVKINDQNVSFISHINKLNNNTMLPLRPIMDAYGAEVSFDKEALIVGIKTEKNYIKITANTREAIINGEAVKLNLMLALEEGSTYISAADAAYLLGLKVEFEGSKRMSFYQ